MTKKHFELFAAMLRRATELGYDRNTIAFIMGSMIVEFKVGNPRFDEERFRKACKGVL